MYNQNWHIVYGPSVTQADLSPDTQVTDAIEMVFRMSGEMGDPGPEIAVSVYGDFADPNGQRDDGSWPDIVVTTMAAFEIREADGEVNYSAYEYTQSDYSYPYDGTDERNPAIFVAVQGEAAEIAARGDDGFDWNGQDPMNRSGGPV